MCIEQKVYNVKRQKRLCNFVFSGGEGGEKISNGSSSTRKWDEINVYDKDKDY